MRPIHPAVVHFPIALMTFSVVVDLLGYLTDSGTLQIAGFLALLGTGIGAAVAIVTGLIDKTRASLSNEALRGHTFPYASGSWAVCVDYRSHVLAVGRHASSNNYLIVKDRKEEKCKVLIV